MTTGPQRCLLANGGMPVRPLRRGVRVYGLGPVIVPRLEVLHLRVCVLLTGVERTPRHFNILTGAGPMSVPELAFTPGLEKGLEKVLLTPPGDVRSGGAAESI